MSFAEAKKDSYVFFGDVYCRFENSLRAAGEKQKEAERIIEKAKKESADILAKAIKVADEEANTIRANARKETEANSSVITAESKKLADKEANKIRTDAKREAEQIVKEAIETARKIREEELAKVTAEAKRQSTWEAAVIVADAKKKAQQIVNEAKNK